MIKADFRFPSPDSASFTVSGHSGYADAGYDIVCAAASSASYLTANTVTEVLKVKAHAEVKDGYMKFSFTGSSDAVKLILGLRLHFEQLQRDYPDFVKVSTEV